MRFVAVVLAVLQHIKEFSLGYMQVRSRRVRTDDLFHALTPYQKSAPRLVVMPIIEQRADGFRTDVFSALVQVRICRRLRVRFDPCHKRHDRVWGDRFLYPLCPVVHLSADTDGAGAYQYADGFGLRSPYF